MDLSYAIVLVFGTMKRLYRENQLAYMVSNRENPENHPIYSIDTDLGSSMLFNEVGPQKDELKPIDSGSGKSDYQSAGADLDSESDDVPVTQEPSDG